jgi:hypothetical protein
MAMTQQTKFTCGCGKKHALVGNDRHAVTVQKKCGCGRTHSISGGKVTTEQKQVKK